MAKRERDTEAGRRERMENAGKLNAMFDRIKLEEIHKWYINYPNPSEKKKHNDLWGRMKKSNGWGMGLDFALIVLEDGLCYPEQFISMRKPQDGELYFKRPSNCPLETCRDKFFPYITFLYLYPWEDPVKYALIRANDMKWKERTSKGNRNRVVATSPLYGHYSINPNKLHYQNIIDGGAAGAFSFPDYSYFGMSLENALYSIYQEGARRWNSK